MLEVPYTFVTTLSHATFPRSWYKMKACSVVDTRCLFNNLFSLQYYTDLVNLRVSLTTVV